MCIPPLSASIPGQGTSPVKGMVQEARETPERATVLTQDRAMACVLPTGTDVALLASTEHLPYSPEFSAG